MLKLLWCLAVSAMIALAPAARAEDPEEETVKVGKGGITVQNGKQTVKVGAAQEGGEGDDEDEEKAPAATGPVLTLTGNGKKVAHTCGGKNATRVNVTGNNNKLTLKGRCEELNVTGNQNVVTVEMVGKITATGNNISVAYKQGLDGKAPKIVQLGSQVSITKLKEP
jgi:hypothetical protein